jgi:hypothetical protein
MGTDTKKTSFTLDETKVGDFNARRLKKSSAWTWTFTVTCSPASEHQLAQIMECYTRTKYLTFAPAEPGLFDDAPVASRGLTEAEMSDEPDLIDDATDEARAH